MAIDTTRRRLDWTKVCWACSPVDDAPGAARASWPASGPWAPCASSASASRPGLDGLGQADLVVLGQQRVLPDVGQVEPDEVFVVALDAFLRQVQPRPSVSDRCRRRVRDVALPVLRTRALATGRSERCDDILPAPSSDLIWRHAAAERPPGPCRSGRPGTPSGSSRRATRRAGQGEEPVDPAATGRATVGPSRARTAVGRPPLPRRPVEQACSRPRRPASSTSSRRTSRRARMTGASVDRHGPGQVPVVGDEERGAARTRYRPASRSTVLGQSARASRAAADRAAAAPSAASGSSPASTGSRSAHSSACQACCWLTASRWTCDARARPPRPPRPRSARTAGAPSSGRRRARRAGRRPSARRPERRRRARAPASAGPARPRPDGSRRPGRPVAVGDGHPAVLAERLGGDPHARAASGAACTRPRRPGAPPGPPPPGRSRRPPARPAVRSCST